MAWKEKASFDLDKRRWRPSPLLGQIVLVTTVNEDGQSNVAPKRSNRAKDAKTATWS